MLKKIWFVFFMMPLSVLAQQFAPKADWRFKNFNKQSHFNSKYIIDMTLDSTGYIWVCNMGVARFDGFKTVQYDSFGQAPGLLRSDYAGSLITDPQGRVWVGDGGLCYYDSGINGFKYIEPDSGPPLTFAFSFCIVKNNLWFVCNYGLAKLNLETLKISLTTLKNVRDPLCIYRYDDNSLWVSSREKLYKYDIVHNTYTANTLVYHHNLMKIYTVRRNKSTCFIATNLGLFTIKPDNSLTLIETGAKDIGITDIDFSPLDKKKEYLLISTDGKGLLIYNTIQKKIQHTYLHDDNNPYSVSSNTISEIVTDKKGTIWLGTSTGICMVDNFNQDWKMRFLKKSNTGNLTALKIAQDKIDTSKLWLTSFNLGMICVNWDTKQIEKIYDGPLQPTRVMDFCQLDKNNWLLLQSNQLLLWDKNKGVKRTIGLSLPDSLSATIALRKIICAGDSLFYITTSKGLFKLNLPRGSLTPVIYKNDFDVNTDLLNGFYEKGVVWAATRAGISCYNTATKKVNNYHIKITGIQMIWEIANTSRNYVACATSFGIALFNKTNKTFEYAYKIANINHPKCTGITVTDSLLWIDSYVGLLKYNIVNKTSERVIYSTPIDNTNTSPFTIINKSLAVGLINGYAYFDLSTKNTSVQPKPVIESVYVNNILQHPATVKNSLQKLKLGYNKNSINIFFTSFFYTNPNSVSFRYRLKGTGENWQYATAEQHNANYAQLAAGSYTFILQCNKGNGIWNNYAASMAFVIMPAYWQTWWFALIMCLVLAFIVFRMYKYRIAQIIKMARVRNKIASDLHDDIGSALSSISIFSEVAAMQLNQKQPHENTHEIIRQIGHHSQAMLDAMDDIVWAVNPKNDHFGHLAIRMREYAIPLFEAKNITFDVDIQDDLVETRLSMAARKNIFLIFKESVNNMLKHSGCTHVYIRIKRPNNYLEMLIKDNGKGFETNCITNRNGLKNMQDRAIEINGVFELISEIGKGTSTYLRVNII